MDRYRRYLTNVKRLVRECDVALEVVDARDVFGTRARKLDMPMKCKVILVAAKADLLPKNAKLLQASHGMPVIYVSNRTREGIGDVIPAIESLPRSIDLMKRGIRIRVAVFGMPNTGKSSLINAIRKKHSAQTGFRPGITRGEQWINLGESILLCDSPGVIATGEDESVLARKCAFEAERLKEPEFAAEKIVELFIRSKNDTIFSYFGIKKCGVDEALEAIAKRRGLILKGGEPKVHEAAKILIREFQRGKFVLMKDENDKGSDGKKGAKEEWE